MIVTMIGAARRGLKMTGRLMMQGNVRISGKISPGKLMVLKRVIDAGMVIVKVKPAGGRGNKNRGEGPIEVPVVKEPAATAGAVGSTVLRATIPFRREEDASATRRNNDGENTNFGLGTLIIQRS